MISHQWKGRVSHLLSVTKSHLVGGYASQYVLILEISGTSITAGHVNFSTRNLTLRCCYRACSWRIKCAADVFSRLVHCTPDVTLNHHTGSVMLGCPAPPYQGAPRMVWHAHLSSKNHTILARDIKGYEV